MEKVLKKFGTFLFGWSIDTSSSSSSSPLSLVWLESLLFPFLTMSWLWGFCVCWMNSTAETCVSGVFISWCWLRCFGLLGGLARSSTATLANLQPILVEEWDAIPQPHVTSLVMSIKRRTSQAVVAVHSSSTCYWGPLVCWIDKP